MVNFVVISGDLQPCVFDTQVKREAKLSTNNYMMMCWIRWQGTNFGSQNVGLPDIAENFGWTLSKRERQISFLGILSECGPFSPPLLSLLLFGSVAAFLLVHITEKTPKPVMDTISKGCRQTEEGDIPSFWMEYWGSLHIPAVQASCSSLFNLQPWLSWRQKLDPGKS